MANSTIMFQGLDPNAKLSSKVLRPPGGGSSDIFGIHDSKVEKPQPTEIIASAAEEQETAAAAPTSEAPLEPSAPVLAEECAAATPVAAESVAPTESVAEAEVSTGEGSAEAAAPEATPIEDPVASPPPPAAVAATTTAAAAGSSVRDGVSIDPQSGRVMSAPAARSGRVPPGGHSTLSLW